MDPFVADTSTSAEAAKAFQSVTSETEKQVRLLERAIQLQEKLESGQQKVVGRFRDPNKAAGPLSGLELAPSQRRVGFLQGGPVDLTLQPTQLSPQQKSNFDKLLEENLNKRYSAWQAMNRGLADQAKQLKFSGAPAARSPLELFSLLQGGFSMRGLHGLAETAQYASFEAGAFRQAAFFGKVTNAFSTLAAGVGPAMLVNELGKAIMDEAENSKAGQTGKAAQKALVEAFSGDDPFETETQRKARIAKIGRILGQDIRLQEGGTSLQGGSQFMKRLERENMLREEFSNNVTALEKDSRARAYLQRELGPLFADGTQSVNEIVSSMLEHGDDAGEIVGKFRRAAGELDEQNKRQKQADYAVKRNPTALAYYRNVEHMHRAIEERLSMEKQDWNDV